MCVHACVSEWVEKERQEETIQVVEWKQAELALTRVGGRQNENSRESRRWQALDQSYSGTNRQTVECAEWNAKASSAIVSRYSISPVEKKA